MDNANCNLDFTSEDVMVEVHPYYQIEPDVGCVVCSGENPRALKS
jgi:hypothetical protein